MRPNQLCSTAICILAVSFGTAADQYFIEVESDNLCDEFGQGWANYCTPQIMVKKAKKKPTSPTPTIIIQAPPSEPKKDPNDPLVWLEKYQENEKRARAKMVMAPSQENVDAYRRDYFNDAMDRGTLVSDYWRRAAWQTPEFDYTLQRPVGYLAKREHDARRNERIDQTVQSLEDRYGIFFVFKSDDPYSTKFAPVLDDFCTRNNITVQGVSVDGKAISGWPRPWRPATQDSLKKLNLTNDYTPAVVLFDRETKQTTPIGFGVMAHDDLSNRLYVLTQLKPGEDY
jgi:conjugal transfer pilus assembly protein TraF